MLEKCSKLPKKNAGNHLSQNSHINQQVRKYWDMIHKFRGKPSVPITCLNLNDQLLRMIPKKQKHWHNIMTIWQNPTFQAAKTAIEEIFKICLPNIENERNNLNSQFTLFELNHALSSKHNSAPGADTVSYEMLKQLPDPSKKELIKLINISWERGYSLRMEIATIIPIIKPHKDKLNPQSYRPISLTSAICKTMETNGGQ